MMTWRILAAALIFAANSARAGTPVPIVGDKPVDPVKVRVDNPAVIPTDGTWKFAMVHGRMTDGHFQSIVAWATASSSQFPADEAIDGKADTRWCAENVSMPQWWQVDLGTTESIAGIDLAWEFADTAYGYRVECGPDEAHLKVTVDKTGHAAKGDGHDQWPAVAARFVRVTVTSAVADGGDEPVHHWASIREAKIAVVRDGKTVVWSPPPAAGHDDDFAAPGFDDAAWHDIPVPSNWEVLGYSKPTYFGPDTAVGLYRRTIDVPADWAGKTILWHCDGVTDSAEVWVNGTRVGYHEGGFTAFEMDLTAAIKPGGKNLIAVRVCKTTPSVDLDTGDYWLLGGIHRESHLLAVPAEHVQDLTITTKLEDAYTNATLRADVKVVGAGGHDAMVTARLVEVDGTPVNSTFFTDTPTRLNDGVTQVSVAATVKAPKLWSAEKPNLYYLLVTLKSGNVTETVEQRFGFRQIEVKDGVLLFNGVPIKCCGTCRHEEWSAIGHALTENEWQTDVAMMKAANINAVRTSHYNHAERFLELCDEKGLYVLDEIPACWVDPKDAKLKVAFVQHAAETLARDKNKPCVLAWSCGNESGWGPDFKAMVDYVAATDPTRPRFVSQVRKSQDALLSFNDYHYSGDNDLRTISTTPGPSVITEGPHTFFNAGGLEYDYGIHDLWGEALAAQWDRVWPSKYLFGAFIWEWQDQGLADKFPDKAGVNADGLRRENNKGIVTGRRVPKPELYHVKMVYSPVVTDQREVRLADGQWVAEFQNRYAFTDLSELTCRWQALSLTFNREANISEGTLPINCPPGKSVAVKFPGYAIADAVRMSFVDKAGVEVYAVRLAVPGGHFLTAPGLVGAPSVSAVDDPASVGATSGPMSVKVDRTTGLVTVAGAGGPVAVGPTLNLGELRHDDGEFSNKNDAPWIGSKSPPVLKNVLVTGASMDAIVSADVTLAEKPDAVLGRLTYEVRVLAGGHMEWNYAVKWTAADMNAWELGLKFDAPGDDLFVWNRKGQWTEYPDGHVGADHGAVPHDDRSFSSTKRDTVWAAMMNEKAGGVVVESAGTPLHTRCKYRDGVTTLLVSSAVSVDRSFSAGYLDYTRIAFKQGRTYSGSFGMYVTDGRR